MAGLRGRLTRHFLARVFLLLVGLSAVFIAWIGVIALWTLEANRTSTPPIQMLREISGGTRVATEGVKLTAHAALDVRGAGMWLQVLDERGDEAAQIDRPRRVPAHYTPGQLVLFRQRPERIGQGSLYTWAERVGERDLTFVLGATKKPTSVPVLTSLTGGQRLLVQLALLATGGGVVLVVGWMFGSSLAKPVAHAMEWLRALAAGDYREPVDRDGRAASRGPNGLGRRPPYATYREVFDALDGLTGELRRSEEERGRLEHAREEWMAGVSHDLRTPLSSVRGYAEVLASDYDFSALEVRRHAEVIRQQAAHMDALLDDLNLTFRLRADALPLARQRVDLVELAREAAVELANDPRAEGREVAFDEAPAPVLAEVDPHWFRRALRNLLVNAVIHNDAGTTARVAVGAENGEALVTVTDDGRGMDAETMSKLFDRHFRGTATAEGAEGSGLGMAIARQLVEAHGGRISVTSEPDRGTRVEVRVPVAP